MYSNTCLVFSVLKGNIGHTAFTPRVPRDQPYMQTPMAWFGTPDWLNAIARMGYC